MTHWPRTSLTLAALSLATPTWAQHQHGSPTAASAKEPCPMVAQVRDVVASLDAVLEQMDRAASAVDQADHEQALAEARKGLVRSIETLQGIQKEDACPLMASQEGSKQNGKKQNEHKGRRWWSMCGHGAH